MEVIRMLMQRWRLLTSWRMDSGRYHSVTKEWILEDGDIRRLEGENGKGSRPLMGERTEKRTWTNTVKWRDKHRRERVQTTPSTHASNWERRRLSE